MCDAYAASMIKTQLEMPLISGVDVASAFESPMPSDTCTSVSLSQRISATQLFMSNNLEADSSSFPKLGDLVHPISSHM
ncbi:hypothetical protein VTI74DRAFT_2506 [Chaetomium olivicolor]